MALTNNQFRSMKRFSNILILLSVALAVYFALSSISGRNIDIMKNIEKVCVNNVVYIRSLDQNSSQLTVLVDPDNKPVRCGN